MQTLKHFVIFLIVICTCLTALWAAEQTVLPVAFLAPEMTAETPGETAARTLAEQTFSAQVINLGTGMELKLSDDIQALWWHGDRVPWPGPMGTPTMRESILKWVGEGHGLLLTGVASAYVTDLGIEPAMARIATSGGTDAVVAGVMPGEFFAHPVFKNFERNQPINLVSSGYPPFADFYATGGPVAGNVIGLAIPDSGENPLCEFAYGKGRIITMGWRLPDYYLTGNLYRNNLEKLTRNCLEYLAGGKWYGTFADTRIRVLRNRLSLLNPPALRRAIEDLSNTYPDQYTRGPEYLQAVARIDEVTAALDAEAPGAIEDAEQLLAQMTQAMLDNPLLNFDKLLLVKRSPANMGLPANWQSNSSLPRTGYDNEIAVLSPVRPEGEIKAIYRPAAGEFVGDVDLDFTGDRMMFSSPLEGGPWRICEIKTDGSGFRVMPFINESDVDNYDSCYLPDGNIAFTSSAPFTGVPCVTGSDHVSNLFLYDSQSEKIRRLTYEQDHDWCPTVMPDGRLLYLRWEYSDLPHFVSRILFTMNPDGTNQTEFYGSNSYWPNSLFYARPLPGSSSCFVGVVGGHHDNPRMGELVVFDRSLGQHEADGAIQRIPGFGKQVQAQILDGLTQNSWPKYLHPYPLNDKYFLTACKPSPSTAWGIYLVDIFDNLTLIKELNGYALLEPLPLRMTKKPPVIPNSVKPERKDALVYLQDIYSGPGLNGVPRGTVKKLRLFTYHFAYHGVGGQVHRVGFDGPWDIKRMIGTVPVDEDGSAYFRVPANTPISVQPLDENGQALQLMRSWMTAMPGETLSCVGCHETKAQPPAANLRTAARRVPSEITNFYGPTRGFAFEREVQPVLNARCISCHDGSENKNGVKLPDFRRAPWVYMAGPENSYTRSSTFSPSYLRLRQYVRGHTIESDMHLLTPGEFSADTTHLIQMLRQGHHGVKLSVEDWDRLITWIDLNTPFHGTWGEIVSPEYVKNQRERRKIMLAKYAGIDEDPEEILPETYTLAPGIDLPQFRISQTPFKQNAPVQLASRETDGLLAPATRKLELVPGVELELVQLPEVSTTGKRLWVGKFEVTNQQFACFDATHDSRLETGDFLQFGIAERGWFVNEPQQPVCRISWEKANRFCNWLGAQTGLKISLPTVEQWQAACSAGNSSEFYFGDQATNFGPYANLADTCLRKVEDIAPWGLPFGAIYEWRRTTDFNDGHRVSAPVGSFQPNAWGLYDMHGNVAEWTSNSMDSGSGSNLKIVKGGSWYDMPQYATVGAYRCYAAYRQVFDVGFRVIVEE